VSPSLTTNDSHRTVLCATGPGGSVTPALIISHDPGHVAFWRMMSDANGPAHDPSRGNWSLSSVVRRLTHQPEHAKQLRLNCQEQTWLEAQEIVASARAEKDKLKSLAFAKLTEHIDSVDERTSLQASKVILEAADRESVNRSRFNDLADPDTRRAALEEMRHPSPAMVELMVAAWKTGPSRTVVDAFLRILDTPEWRAVVKFELNGDE
jgi:hypothetical protein